jgi:tRNA nucleotidyltransferase (CCA-adding enzyme)
MAEANQRLIVAELVAGKADKIFKNLGPDWTNRDRQNLWEEVRVNAISAGCTGLEKRDYTYVRDTIWGGAKRDAMKKFDISKKSGEGSVKFNKVN